MGEKRDTGKKIGNTKIPNAKPSKHHVLSINDQVDLPLLIEARNDRDKLVEKQLKKIQLKKDISEMREELRKTEKQLDDLAEKIIARNTSNDDPKRH